MGGLDALSAGDKVMLSRAADLLLTKPSGENDKVRLTSAAWRIIERIRKRAGGLVAI